VHWLILVALAVAELAWLVWFLLVPLPNANPLGTAARSRLNRGWILLKTFPEVVPGTSFRESFLGQALDELSHLGNLPQRIPIVLAACLIAAAAAAAGDLAVRTLGQTRGLTWVERISLGFGLGTALLGAIALILGRLGWLSPPLVRTGLALVVARWLFSSRPWLSIRSIRFSAGWLPALALAPFVVVMLLGSMLPAVDFDVIEYHLQGPKEYFLAGRISFLPHNVYTSMPFGVEMLHLLGMEVLGDWWWGALAGQLLVALFAPAAAGMIAATALRAGSPRGAWIAVIVYLSTPWIYRLAVIAYVEGPLCFFHAALVWAVVRGQFGREISRGPLWGLTGLLAGGAMSCKYPALISAVIPFGVIALIDARRNRSVVPVTAYVLGWAIVMTPWLGKNIIDTGNPVYPLANSIFQGRYWDPGREAKWVSAHGPRVVSADQFCESIVDVAGRSDWQSPLYLALAPLALARAGSRRLAVLLWYYVTYLFLTWWLLTHRLDRFWLPLLPPLALLAGLGADWTRGRGWSLLLGAILTLSLTTNFSYISTALAGLNEWTGDLTFLRRDIPARLNPPLSALDRELPADARVLLVGQAAVFHFNHQMAYNTVFNEEELERLAGGKTVDEFRRGLEDRGLTHIYVDWKEIERHRQPGGYGFTDFVTPERFAEWVKAGLLERPERLGSRQELYRVRRPKPEARPR
jgi:hypothetical protein